MSGGLVTKLLFYFIKLLLLRVDFLLNRSLYLHDPLLQDWQSELVIESLLGILMDSYTLVDCQSWL